MDTTAYHGLAKVRLHVGAGVVHVLGVGEALPQDTGDIWRFSAGIGALNWQKIGKIIPSSGNFMWKITIFHGKIHYHSTINGQF